MKCWHKVDDISDAHKDKDKVFGYVTGAKRQCLECE